MMRRCTLSLVLKYGDAKSWWCLVDLASKTCIVLTLAAFKDAAWQVQFLALIMVPHLFAQLYTRPYRFLVHNFSETAVLFAKVALLGCSIPFFEPATKGQEPTAGETFVTLIIAVGVCLFVFVWGTCNMCIWGVQLSGGGEAQVRMVTSRLVKLLPPHREGHGLVSLVPGNEVLARIDAVGSARDRSAGSALGQKIQEFATEKRELLAVLSLKLKQDCVVWTLAEHWARGTPSESTCNEMKKCQQEVLQKCFRSDGGFDQKAFETYVKERSAIMSKLVASLNETNG